MAIVRGWPSQIRPLDTCGIGPEDHFESAAATEENAWNLLHIRRTVEIHPKPRATHRESLRNANSSYELLYVDKPSKMTGQLPSTSS